MRHKGKKLSIYARIISVVKPISRIVVNVGGANKDVTGVYTFVNGVRKQVWPSSNANLLATLTTPGAFSYYVPDQYKYIMVEIAGAAGQSLYIGNGMSASPRAGYGAIKRYTITSLSNRTITGVIGAQPAGNQSCIYGGVGYQNGTDGTMDVYGGSTDTRPGGGGGSTSVVIDGTTRTAGGGSGAGLSLVVYAPQQTRYVLKGGNGGGPNGGVAQNPTYDPTPDPDNPIVYDGVNATDATYGYNTGSGYVRIYGIY